MPLDYLGARELLELELRQRRESGYDVEGLDREVDAALADPDSDEAPLLELLDRLGDVRRRPDWPYEEPERLEDIEASLPPPREPAELPADLDDRLLGAWTGRCVGNNLGKPIEWGDHWTPDHIEDYLTRAGAWPLRDYIPVLDPMPAEFELNESWPTSARGHIDGTARDDDLDYTLLALHLLEQHPGGPSTQQVADAVLERLPVLATYTAERVIYRHVLDGLPVEEVGGYRNPYREWIGAQIRADVFGMVNPGDPRRAARAVYQDARLSHRGNGVYAAMWSAALVAEALVLDSAHEAVTRSLEHVPPRSRLHAAISGVLDDHARGRTWRQARDAVEESWGGYHWVHAVNNAAVLTAGLLWGEGDFTETVSLTVVGGLDTDSSGATAGSVAGALLGTRAIDAHWTEPLHDRMHSALSGFDGIRISEAAARTATLVDRY